MKNLQVYAKACEALFFKEDVSSEFETGLLQDIEHENNAEDMLQTAINYACYPEIEEIVRETTNLLLIQKKNYNLCESLSSILDRYKHTAIALIHKIAFENNHVNLCRLCMDYWVYTVSLYSCFQGLDREEKIIFTVGSYTTEKGCRVRELNRLALIEKDLTEVYSSPLFLESSSTRMIVELREQKVILDPVVVHQNKLPMLNNPIVIRNFSHGFVAYTLNLEGPMCINAVAVNKQSGTVKFLSGNASKNSLKAHIRYNQVEKLGKLILKENIRDATWTTTLVGYDLDSQHAGDMNKLLGPRMTREDISIKLKKIKPSVFFNAHRFCGGLDILGGDIRDAVIDRLSEALTLEELRLLEEEIGKTMN